MPRLFTEEKTELTDNDPLPPKKKYKKKINKKINHHQHEINTE